MVESRLTRVLLRVGAGSRSPSSTSRLFIIGLYAFNAQVTAGWPIEDYSTKWFSSRSTTRTCGRR